MSRAVLAILVVGGLVVAVAGQSPDAIQAYADRAAAYPATGGELLAFTVPAGERHQQLTVIDPKLRVMSVYHVDLASGEIGLKSVRNIHWDLQLLEYNGVTPLPREVRAQIETR